MASLGWLLLVLGLSGFRGLLCCWYNIPFWCLSGGLCGVCLLDLIWRCLGTLVFWFFRLYNSLLDGLCVCGLVVSDDWLGCLLFCGCLV